MARLNKEIGNSIVNGSPESLQGDADSMKKCFTSTLDFTIHRFIDESRVMND